MDFLETIAYRIILRLLVVHFTRGIPDLAQEFNRARSNLRVPGGYFKFRVPEYLTKAFSSITPPECQMHHSPQLLVSRGKLDCQPIDRD